jgi:hypothetical protein
MQHDTHLLRTKNRSHALPSYTDIRYLTLVVALWL